jgi:Putative transposase
MWNGPLYAHSQASLTKSGEWRRLRSDLYAHDWVMYAKRQFAGPEQVLNYLGRYNPLSGDLQQPPDKPPRRLRALPLPGLCSWQSPQDNEPRRPRVHPPFSCCTSCPKALCASGIGFLANRTKAEKLACCRGLLDAPPPLAAPPETVDAFLLRVIGSAHDLYPACHTGAARPAAPAASYAAMRHDSLPRGPPH